MSGAGGNSPADRLHRLPTPLRRRKGLPSWVGGEGGDGVGVTSDGEEIDVMRRPVRGRHGAAVHAEAEKKKGLRLVP